MDWDQPIRRRTLLKVAGVGVATYLVNGCSATGTPTSTPAPASTTGSAPTPAVGSGAPVAPKRVSAVRMAAIRAQGLFEPPNAFGSNTGPAGQQTSYLFDSLVQRDSTTEPLPWLAEKWTLSPDGTEWTFTLREGVRFHDGETLTADDVEFSFQYLASHPAGQLYTTAPQVVKEAKALDPRTVRITLKDPFAPFLNNVASSMPIFPKHIWAGIADPMKFNDPKAFIGSGPYTLAAINAADSSMLFVANDDFFLGKPYVQRIEFIPVGDDLLALKAGQLDVAAPTATTGLTNDVLAPFRSDPKYVVLEAHGEGTTALHFNLSKGAPYDDVAFRRAVVFAIDRQQLVSRFLTDNGEIGSPGFLPTANPYSTKEVEQYPYDPQRAKTLLDQAGYREQGGQRTRPDGSPLTVMLMFGAPSARVAEFLRGQLAQVGIQVELRSVDQGTANQLQAAGNYELSLVTYGGLGSDPDFMRRAFGSPDQAQFWYKAWGYHSAEFDQLAGQQLRAFDDQRRHSLVQQMQRIVSQDVPIMPLFYPTRYVIYVLAVFDGWYFTPLSNPLAMNKHFFVTGQKTGLAIRQK